MKHKSIGSGIRSSLDCGMTKMLTAWSKSSQAMSISQVKNCSPKTVLSMKARKPPSNTKAPERLK